MANNIVFNLIDRTILGALAGSRFTAVLQPNGGGAIVGSYPAIASFSVAAQITDSEAIQLLALWNLTFSNMTRDQVLGDLSSRGTSAPSVQYSEGDRVLLELALAATNLQINYPLSQTAMAPYAISWKGQTYGTGSPVPLDLAAALGIG